MITPETFIVHVEVSLSRPPHADEVRRYAVVAPGPLEAELIAVQWAYSSPGVVMPVGSRVVDVAP